MADVPDEVRQEVKDILLDHRGADDPITSREINEELDLDSVGSFPNTRAVIRDIVIHDEIPIAGSSMGYYVIETEDELRDYVDQLDRRARNIMERRIAVLKAAEEWHEDIIDDEDTDLL